MNQFVESLAPLHLYPLWRPQGLLMHKPKTRAVHEHINSGSRPALLFSFTDDPTLRSLGFYQEQTEKRQVS